MFAYKERMKLNGCFDKYDFECHCTEIGEKNFFYAIGESSMVLHDGTIVKVVSDKIVLFPLVTFKEHSFLWEL